MQSLLEKYCKMAQTSAGQVTVDVFASNLGVPVSEALQTMFNMYDRVSRAQEEATVDSTDNINDLAAQGCVLLLRRDADASMSANGSAAFIWKLRCHWVMCLRQRHVTIIRQGPGLQ